MSTVKLKYEGKTAIALKTIGPVAPGDEKNVPEHLVESVLADERWSRVTKGKGKSDKEERHGAE